MNRIGVGVIGASPLKPGWAVGSHLPALAALPDYELRAVAVSTEKSAKAAKEAFSVPAYSDAAEMIARSDVDLVVVGVNLRHHYDFAAKAITAGKMVMCEWPLAPELKQTKTLGEQARKANLPTLTGLQARMIPAIRYARHLVAQGYIGDVLSTTIFGSCPPWSAVAPSSLAYIFDAKTNASVLSVPTMHAVDALQFVLGNLSDIRAIDAVRQRVVTFSDTGETVSPTTPDHVAIAATLESGAVASIFYRGGKARGDHFRWEIHGSEGDLVFTSPVGFIQTLPPTLLAARGDGTSLAPLEIPAQHDPWPEAPPGPAANVARLYAAFAKDLRDATPGLIAPDFSHATRLHELQNLIADAAATGTRQTVVK